MPQTKTTPDIKAARAVWREIDAVMNPLPEVTAPEDTAMWEQQLWAHSVGIAERKRAEDDYIEGVRRQARQKVIDELLRDATRFARRQRTIEWLWRNAHRNSKTEAPRKMRKEACYGRPDSIPRPTGLRASV